MGIPEYPSIRQIRGVNGNLLYDPASVLHKPANASLQTPNVQSRIPSRRTQFPIIKPKDPARRLTSEMVAAAEEQLLDEEAGAHGRFAGHVHHPAAFAWLDAVQKDGGGYSLPPQPARTAAAAQ